MADFSAIIFDFDGVLLESEFESNRHLTELLGALGHDVTMEEALTRFIGLAGDDYIAAIENRIGATLPPDFRLQRKAEVERAKRDGIAAVNGAIDFVRSLPPELPKAVASSSRRDWIATHLAKLGLLDAFAGHFYSGAEDVERGKPAPDLYLHAAAQLGIPIETSIIIEDSEVGATGALASGGRVIGLAAGRHCLTGHTDRLRALGVEEVAESFDEVKRLLRL